jgi:hypothetical protein
MRTQGQRLVLAGLLMLIILVVGGMVVQAQDDDGDSRPRLRVINSAVGVPSADIYGETGGRDILFLRDVFYSYVSNYIPVQPGGFNLKVWPAGIKAGNPLTGTGWDFADNQDYTMAIVGTAEQIDEPWVFVDNNKEPLLPGKARVRMLHLASRAPAIEICLDNDCKVLTFQKPPEAGAQIDQFGSTYLTLEAGTYNLNIRIIGTDEIYYDVIPIGFEAGQVYTIFIVDPVQGEVRPRIIPYMDTGHLYPQPPGDAGQPFPYPPEGSGKPHPYPPDGAGPPHYPPVTGALLSPTAFALITVITLVTGLVFWLAWRQFSRS